MPQILRTTLIDDEAHAVSGTFNFDLPVNPLSVILLTIKGLNIAGPDGDVYDTASGLFDPVTNIRIAYRGATIIEGGAEDLAVMYSLLSHWHPGFLIERDADNQARAVTLPLCFGRRPYDPLECFPATRRGDLIMSLTLSLPDTSFDNIILQAETIELLEAVPTRFTKVTTISKVHAAAGDHDIELPISNDILGAMLFSPVAPDISTYATNFGRVRLQVDNVETMFSDTNWETLHGELVRKLRSNLDVRWHAHYKIVGPPVPDNYTEGQVDDSPIAANRAYLDMDPLEDGQYALRTAGAARVNLRVTDDIGSATAIRVLPVELVQLGAPGTPA